MLSEVKISHSNIRDLPRPDFIEWLVEEDDIQIGEVATRCFRLEGVLDEAALQAWALHVRRHYIRDDELDEYVEINKINKKDYLYESCIPDTPQIMSGDFAEIMISDLLQFIEGYEVPRYKQHARKDKNSSEHGTDVIAYKVANLKIPSMNDELLAVEVKSRSASSALSTAISEAAKDSPKDRSRVAMTLAYYSRCSLQSGDERTAAEIRRFLVASEHPFHESFGIGVVVGIADARRYLRGRSASDLFIKHCDKVFIVHRANLMNLIYAVYDRCVL